MASGQCEYLIYSFNKLYEKSGTALVPGHIRGEQADKTHVLMEYVFSGEHSSYKYIPIARENLEM